jgi:hypothetical protein
MKRPQSFFIFLLLIFPLVFSGQQIENPGFENWEDAGTVKDEPVDWSSIKTCDNQNIADAAPVTFDTCTDAHSGNYSLKLYNVFTFGISATGAVCNGRFHADFNINLSYSYTEPSDPKWNTPFTFRPDSLVGWFKYFPQENDAAQFKAILHVGECKLPENGTLPNWVGMAAFKTEKGATYDTWTRFSVPFEYYSNNTPEHLLFVVNSGDSTISVPDSYLLVDDLEFKYSSSGIQDHDITEAFLVTGENKLIINLASEEEYLNRRFDLIDLRGRIVLSRHLASNEVILATELMAGVYIAVLDGKNKRHVQKVMLR